MTRSLGGNATPLGALRRRLAPLTGSAVWGEGGCGRPRAASFPLNKVDCFGSALADAHRRLRVSGPPEDFHFPESPNLAAPPPTPNTCVAEDARTGSRRQSGASPHPLAGSGYAGGDGGLCKLRTLGRPRLESRELRGWAGYLRPPADHRPARWRPPVPDAGLAKG